MAIAFARLGTPWTAVARQGRPQMAARQLDSRRQHCRSGVASRPPRLVSAAAQQEEVEGAFCMPAFVTCDNNRSKCFTVLDIEIGDYPGLLRVISWTLNGLDVVAQNAVVRTDEGFARNTFWLTTRRGKKLSDTAAELLADRVRDFVTYCSPDESAARKTEFSAGPIHISNSQHEDYTVLTVQEPQPTPGFLLEVASALSGMNTCILQGVVKGGICEDEPMGPQQLDELNLDKGTSLLAEGTEGRTFTFWLRNSQGTKLDWPGMTALVYTLSSVLGYRSHPTVPPDQEMLMSAR